MEYISQNIKRLRKLKNLTQKEIAMEVEIPQGQYSRIEGGKVIPTVQTLAKIALALGVHITELFTENSVEEVADLSLLNKIKLLDELEEDEKDALLKIIDMAIAKKRMKDNLGQLMAM
jgi:transcriptional regulator with XRE-family HTH domain